MNQSWALALLVACFGSACASPTLYYWGQYEEVLYRSYLKPGEWPPLAQIQILEKDEQKASAQGRALPPGFYAHLGFLYFETGQFDQARRSFEREKQRFPGSAPLMDRFLRKLKSS
ncbi:MAG: DUF4810 domain-containing protein [Bdellovibrionia bacterium]